MSLVLGIAFIALSVAKPCSPTAYPTTQAHVVRELCLTTQAQVVFLVGVFIELGEFYTFLLDPVFVPVFMLCDLVAYECHLVLHCWFQSHP